ncbi:TIGR01777 family oxidoreductase [Calycomorphotria hydatis]|nr:TIGR01777 family oxidoreductase [Calycomorphotria hydatis]
MSTFEYQSILPFPPEEVFQWHANPGAFQRLTPPWEPVEMVSTTGGIRDGDIVELKVSPVWPVNIKMVAKHQNYKEGESFQDVQQSGPFTKWEHTHSMQPTEEGCRLIDHIEYQAPLGIFDGFFQPKLRKMFTYRHAATRDDLNLHHQYRDRERMHVLISGATGLVGSQLMPFLTTGGHTVSVLSRSKSVSDPAARNLISNVATWDIKNETVDLAELPPVDAVVHLAGEPILGRWTEEKKRRIYNSRVNGTRLLCEALAKLPNKPKVLVCASAVGIYGDRGDEVLTESSPPFNELEGKGNDFLSETCMAWEVACEPARQAGIRVVNLRVGIVLSQAGGALKQMLPIFQAAAGGRLGSGQQWWSWISLDDLIGAIHHAMMNEEVTGPMNGTAPEPVTNAQFTKMLGRVLRRPTCLPVPEFGPKLLLGEELANATLFVSARVEPKLLQETGYTFRHPSLEGALKHLLGK